MKEILFIGFIFIINYSSGQIQHSPYLSELQRKKIDRFNDSISLIDKRHSDVDAKRRLHNVEIDMRNDSIHNYEIYAETKQKEIDDSISNFNYKKRQQQQVAQNIIYQKKLADKKEKNRIENEERKISLREKYGNETAEHILNRKVKIGWTKEMCIESWGKPYDINRTTRVNGTSEQWVYSMKKYLYFDNNTLTTIQD